VVVPVDEYLYNSIIKYDDRLLLLRLV